MLLPASPKMRGLSLGPHGTVHAGCGAGMREGRGGSSSLYATKKECFISNQRTGLFLLTSFGVAPFTGATPFPWNHPCLQPTCSHSQWSCACVCAHACAQLCAFVCVSECAWILLQFDPTQIFLKEKQRGGRLCGLRTRPTEPLHRSQWNLYL